MYFDVLLLDVCTFTIVVSSCCIDPFIIKSSPTIHLVLCIVVKSTLLDINTVILFFFLLVLVWYIFPIRLLFTYLYYHIQSVFLIGSI